MPSGGNKFEDFPYSQLTKWTSFHHSKILLAQIWRVDGL